MTEKILKQKIMVTVTNQLIRWYEAKGYKIPKEKVQLWYSDKEGNKKKNGITYRVVKGTKITVKVQDLPPSSNVKVPIKCPRCSETSHIQMRTYKDKHSDLCNSCTKRKIKDDGSHSYWVSKLITNNPKARCDISGETDKRFLVLHHLKSKSLGGRNIEENYVILSANYHMAFHMSCGGTNVPCTKEQYMKFKEKESQTDVLAEDWVVVE